MIVSDEDIIKKLKYRASQIHQRKDFSEIIYVKSLGLVYGKANDYSYRPNAKVWNRIEIDQFGETVVAISGYEERMVKEAYDKKAVIWL